MIKHLAIPALMVAALCLTTTPAWSDKGRLWVLLIIWHLCHGVALFL